MRGENLDLDGIRRTLNAMGGVSTVVAGDSQMIKVHTHVPMPGKVLDYGVSLGSLLDINIENLQEQSLAYAEESARERGLTGMNLHSAALQNGAHSASPPAALPAPPAPAVERLPVGVVAVAAGEGWARLFESYHLGGVVPGGQTMNPSTEDLLRAVEACPSDKRHPAAQQPQHLHERAAGGRANHQAGLRRAVRFDATGHRRAAGL